MPQVGNVTQMMQYSAILALGLSRVFKDDIPTHKKLYTAWLAERSAKEWVEDELITTGFGPMPPKPVGSPFIVDKPFISNPKDYTMVPHGLGFVAEYELFRWDKYAVFTDMTKKLTRSGTDRKNILGYSPLNNGFSTADPVYTTYNGEALFDSTHQLLRGGTAKNAPSGVTGLSYLGIQEGLSDFMMLTNEDGIFIILEPSLLICHPTMAWVASTLLESKFRPDNANQAKNTLSDAGLTYHTSPYLTSTTAWFLMANKEKLEIRLHIGDDLMFRRDFQMSTWNNVIAMYASFRLAVLHWYGTWGSAGA
jgi:hypothetical protein